MNLFCLWLQMTSSQQDGCTRSYFLLFHRLVYLGCLTLPVAAVMVIMGISNLHSWLLSKSRSISWLVDAEAILGTWRWRAVVLYVTLCAFLVPGLQQTGDALLAAPVTAETLGVQQHTGSERQLVLPNPGLPPHRPGGQRQW